MRRNDASLINKKLSTDIIDRSGLVYIGTKPDNIVIRNDNIMAEFLVSNNIVSFGTMKKALSECVKYDITVEKYLARNNLCDVVALTKLISEKIYGYEYADVNSLNFDYQLLMKYPALVYRNHTFLPVSIDDKGILTIVTAYPENIDVYTQEMMFDVDSVKYVITTETDFMKLLLRVSNEQQARKAAVEIEKNIPQYEFLRNNIFVENDPALAGSGVEIVELVDSILAGAIQDDASDIHLEPFRNEFAVRYRINGLLKDRFIFPIASYKNVGNRLKIMSYIDSYDSARPHDGHVSYLTGGRVYDLRVSTIPTVYGEKFVIRIFGDKQANATREELGFSDESNILINKMLARPNGLILVTGPTGCGKTTTLYAFIKELRQPGVSITTIEDPVERVIPRITQIAVERRYGQNFSTILREIIRQDPDVIMIGEIRDEESAAIAVRAASTGHLVLSTLHTNDAPGAVTRLFDMKVEGYLISDALIGVISQRLVRTLCPLCKVAEFSNAEETAYLGLDEPVTIYHPGNSDVNLEYESFNINRASKCRECGGVGYHGRTAIQEILLMTPELRRLISTEKIDPYTFREIVMKGGMTTLRDNCIKHVLDGTTSIEEMRRCIVEY